MFKNLGTVSKLSERGNMNATETWKTNQCPCHFCKKYTEIIRFC